MSQYVILARTAITPNSVIDPYCLATADEQPARFSLYALTTTHNPVTGLAILENYCPLKLELVHAIQSGSRTESLKQTLEIKFRNHCIRSFWYALASEEVEFIQAINEQNIIRVIGLIQRQERKPELSAEGAAALIQEQIAKAGAMIK